MAEPATSTYRRRERIAPPRTWNPDRVVAALRDWAAEFGEPPRTTEWGAPEHALDAIGRERAARWAREHPRWPSPTTVSDHLGSWEAAMEAAGLRERRLGPWELSLPERVEAARRMTAEGTSAGAIATYLNVSAQTVRKYLKASRCPGCAGPVVQAQSKRCVTCAQAVANPPAWTGEGIVEALRAWLAEEGAPPMERDWDPSDDPLHRWAREYPRWPSSLQVYGRFGSWRSALVAAGIDPFARLGGPRSDWDRESIVIAIREFMREHGRAPMRRDWEWASEEHPTVSLVEVRFGSWGRGLRAAGAVPARIRWDRASIIDAIRRYADDHGRPPKTSDWERRHPDGRWPSEATVYAHFESWRAALLAAGQPVRRQWDRESVLDALRGFADVHGRAPKVKELHSKHRMPSAEALAAQFGSVAAAYEAVGLPPPRRREWDRSSALAAIQSFAEATGGPPMRAEWNANRTSDQPSSPALERLFGSWSAALLAAGLQPRWVSWDRESIVAALRAWTVENGRPPRQIDWTAGDPRNARPSQSVAAHHFGSWSGALQAAGVLPPNQRRWARAEAIEAVQASARAHGRRPRSTEWTSAAADHPAAATVSRLFGSWPAGLEAAGFPRQMTGWSRESIIEALRVSSARHGRPPRKTEWAVGDPSCERPTNTTVRNHFGSWQAALRAAGLVPLAPGAAGRAAANQPPRQGRTATAPDSSRNRARSTRDGRR